MSQNELITSPRRGCKASLQAVLLPSFPTLTWVGFCAHWAVLTVLLDFPLLPRQPGSNLCEKQAAIAQQG